MWCLKWLVLSRHNPPNAKKPSVPKIGASVLYPQYIAWCTKAKQAPIVQGSFRAALSVLKQELQLATRASKQGSGECPVCSVLKRAEVQTISLSHKAAIKKLYLEHMNFVNGEVAVYNEHIFAGKDDDKVCIVAHEYIIFHSHVCNLV